MSVTEVDQSARSDSFPEGIAMQPREYSFEDLDAIPKYWNLDNPVLTHFETAFSIMIPPGERFFIDSVRAYEDRVTDDEGRALIEAFVRQEGLHGEAHDRFNASYERYGIDIARQEAYAAKVFRRARRWLPAKIQLGITVFSEHLTAVGAHTLLDAPEVEDEIDPQMLSFWRWHAAEELEHKSVAFDLFHRVGGGYATRMLSVLAAALFLAVPMVRITRALLREDPHQATAADRKQALAVQRRMGRRQLPLFLAYFKPGFHPWQIDDSGMLREWYRQGSLAQAS
ncbi:MAG: metal-dependent hydrolase [Microthrixaceae bacterium]|nr:metal-dependent hydrolase [Microthrixaceae bacterium]MCB9386727.1 metal-dependent hydrolase [Microthrixaceae bacterium]